MSPVSGLDIGGANLKAAHTDGQALSVPFELWKNAGPFAGRAPPADHEMPPADVLAVTMTGELCDCFESKRQGVLAILDAVAAVADDPRARLAERWPFRRCRRGRAAPLHAASANWLALALSWVVMRPEGRPCSSTSARQPPTSFRCGTAGPSHKDARIPSGCVRRSWCTPAFGGRRCAPCWAVRRGGVVRDHAGRQPDPGRDPGECGDCRTADGRPATKAAAHARLARMLCATSTPAPPTSAAEWPNVSCCVKSWRSPSQSKPWPSARPLHRRQSCSPAKANSSPRSPCRSRRRSRRVAPCR